MPNDHYPDWASTMSENIEHRDAKSFGLSRGLLARLVPITLFVGLGSFAVVQSIIGDKQVAEANSGSTALVSTEGAPATPLISEQEISNANANQAPTGPISTMKLTAQPQFENGIGATPPMTPTEKPFNALPIVKPPTNSVADMLNNKTPAKDSGSGPPFQGNEMPPRQTATPPKLLGDSGTPSQKQFNLNDANQSFGPAKPVINGGTPQGTLNLRDPASEKMAGPNPAQKPNSNFTGSNPAGTLNPPDTSFAAPTSQSFGTPLPSTLPNSGPPKQTPSQIFGDSNIQDTKPKPMGLGATNQTADPLPIAQSPSNPPRSSLNESNVQNGINMSVGDGNRQPSKMQTDNAPIGIRNDQTTPMSTGITTNPNDRFAPPTRDSILNGSPTNNVDRNSLPNEQSSFGGPQKQPAQPLINGGLQQNTFNNPPRSVSGNLNGATANREVNVFRA